jgi:hypothetical protein
MTPRLNGLDHLRAFAIVSVLSISAPPLHASFPESPAN